MSNLSDDLLLEIKRIKGLQTERTQNPTAATSLQAEIDNLNLYEIAAGIGTERDLGAMSPTERALHLTDFTALEAMHGPEVTHQLRERFFQAHDQMVRDRDAPRSNAQAVGDAALGFAGAPVGTAFGLAGLAASPFSEDVASRAAELGQEWNETIQGLQSDSINARRRVNEALGSIDRRENELQSDGIVKELKNFGDAVINTIDDPGLLVQGTSEAAGSMVGGATAAAPLRALGKKVVSTKLTKVAAKVGPDAAEALADATKAAARSLGRVDAAAAAAGLGAVEIGGSYQNAVLNVLSKTPEELTRTSADFREKVEELTNLGLSKNEAEKQTQRWLANRTGQVAAGLATPGAMALGFLGRAGATPTKVLRSYPKDVATEGIEESLQDLSGNLAQNLASKAYIDPGKELLDSIGYQMGQSAVLGVTSAGGLKAPGAVFSQESADLIRSAGQAVTSVADKRIAAEEAKSASSAQALDERSRGLYGDQVKDTALSEAILNLQIPDEDKLQIQDSLMKLQNSLIIEELPQIHGELSEENQALIEPNITRATAADRIARRLLQEKDVSEQVKLAIALQDILDPVHQNQEDSSAIDHIRGNEAAMEVVGEYKETLANIGNLPSVRRALEKSNEIVQRKLEKTPVITEENLETPEGLEAIRMEIAQANLQPGTGNIKNVETILKHALKIRLTQSQKAALEGSLALLRSREALENTRIETAKLEGRHLTGQEKTGSQITVGLDPQYMEQSKYSAKQHTSRIIGAMKAGNTRLAQEYLRDFALFTQHMQNKLEALNKSYAEGNYKGKQIPYEQLLPDRSWAMSNSNPYDYAYKGEFVNIASVKSIQHAQEVDAEAELLYSILENLTKAYPSLKVEMPNRHRLHEDLRNRTPEEAKKLVWEKTRKTKPSSKPEPKKAVEVEKTPAPQEARTEENKPSSEPTPQKKDETAQEPSQEPKEAKAPSEPETKPIEPAPVEENIEKKNLTEFFSSLVPQNKFIEAFRIRKVDGKFATRTFGEKNPIEFIRKVLSSQEEFKKLLGKNSKGNLTKEIAVKYEDLLSTDSEGINVGRILSALDQNLTQFINTKLKKAKNPEEAYRWANGKLLNITEQNQDGQLQFNQELKELAAMAALHWWLNNGQRQPSHHKDEDDIASEFGLDAESVDNAILQRLAQGQSLVEIKHSLASTIRRFWGIQAKAEELTGYTEAIPEAMAAELIEVFEQIGLVEVDVVEIDGKTPHRYLFANLPEGNPIEEYPSALEEAVVVDAEPTAFYEDDEVPLSKTLLSNRRVETTEGQDKARKNMQEVKHFLNMPMVEWYLDLSEDGIIEAFGTPLPKDEEEAKKLYNKNDLISIQGLNRSLLAAFRELKRVKAEMENRAGESGDISKIGKKYAYAVNSVNRIMMQGAHNPQASKLMREALLPTWSNLDISTGLDSSHYRYFLLATAQALGQKIHRQEMDKSVLWAHEVIQGEYAPAVDILAKWLKEKKKFPLAQFHAALPKGAERSPLLTFTLMEHARIKLLKESNPEGLKDFRTALYLEADGMTNGPFNSLGLLSVGAFTADWVNATRKGGVSLGTEARTANTLSEGPKDDLYQAAVNAAQKHIYDRLKHIQNQFNGGKNTLEVANSLFKAMSILLPDDVTFNDGELILQRGIGKNPMTVLVYGSGVQGIANKLTHALTQKFYEKLSLGAQAQQAGKKGNEIAQAMFPNDSSAEAVRKATELGELMNLLAKAKTTYNKEKDAFFSYHENWNPIERLYKKGYQEFTFTPAELKNMQNNFARLFVEPLREGVEDILGKSVKQSGDLLRSATQAMAVVTRNLYLKAIEDKVKEKKAKDPNYKPDSEFLTTTELNEVWESLKPLLPLVHADGQAFLVAKQKLLEFWDDQKNKNRELYEYSRSLNDKRRTAPYVMVVDDPGVSAIPYLTIGMGDARMVREIFQEAMDRSMQVFDGINIPVDKIEEYGQKINQAALHAWQGNVFQAVGRSFDQFLTDPRVEEIFNNPELAQDTLNKLLPPGQKPVPSDTPGADLRLSFATIAENLNHNTLDMQARRMALAEISLSMDQMAGTFSPYVQKGQQLDEEASSQEIADFLNERRLHHLETLKAKEKKTKPQVKPKKGPKDIFTTGRKHSSGVYILGKTAIQELPSRLKKNLTEAEIQLLGEIVRSKALDGYKIVAGTRSQVAAYQREVGATSLSVLETDQEILGFFSASEKTIYMMNPSVETLLHEMIHASSFASIQAYYEGKELGVNSETVKEAIIRLEKLMDMFLLTDFQATGELAESIDNAIHAIKEHRDNGNPAAALSEFMAWTQANRKIAEDLATNVELPKNDTLSRLVRITKAAYKAIKNLIWGRKKAPKYADDILSQIRFNSGIIIRNQPTLEKLIRDATLLHAVRRGSENTRLGRIREAFSRRIARHLGVTYGPNWAQEMLHMPEVKEPLRNATALTRLAETFFHLDPEESSTFQMMVAALATEADLNPNALVEAQKLYIHFLENLTPDDFLTGVGNTQYDTHWATKKFDFILGRTIKKWDENNRSSILPVFIALATTSEEFRKVLTKKNVPKTQRKTVEGLDTALENLGNEMLDQLDSRLAGINKPANMRDAVDQLTWAVTQATYKEHAFLEKALLPGKALNIANQKLVGFMRRIGSASLTKGDEFRESDSKIKKALGVALEGVAVLTSEQESAVIAERTIKALDEQANLWEPFRDLMNDIIGRTESAGAVYDMVKKVRTFVSHARQDYREKVPRIIKSKFNRKLSVDEWDTNYRVMGRWDMASLLEGKTTDQVLDLASDEKALKAEISKLENELKASKHWNTYSNKIDQYVNFVRTGIAGPNLLRNAHAIANLFGEVKQKINPSASTIKTIDQLITLRLLDSMEKDDRARFTSLVQDEREGMKFTLNYLRGQRTKEMEKIEEAGPAIFNYYKGYLPADQTQQGRLIVAEDNKHTDLRQLGYIRIGPYKGSNLESKGASKSYFFNPDGDTRPAFAQGIAQNVQQTAYGVHLETGLSLDHTAGVIRDSIQVSEIAQRMHQEKAGPENLQPIYSPFGAVVAFERSIDPLQRVRVLPRQDLSEMIGIWRGRQAEEEWATKVNMALVDHLHQMYEKDPDKDRYIDLLNDEVDPVIQDAVSLFSKQMHVLIRSKFGDAGFPVRRSMLNYTIGYRNASVGDMWTGTTRWSKDVQDVTRKSLISIFGIEAYRKLVKAEKNIQATMLSVRTNIVIRSVVVPLANTISGIYQLIARGVTLSELATIPKKIAEIEYYTKSLIRKVELEAELRANENNPQLTQKIKAELQTLLDSQRRLSIWPLLEAGEFSTISDVGMTADDLGLTSGNIMDWLAKKVDELPPTLRDAARQGYMARDTSLFQALQKAVQYSDFVMKAVYFDHLITRANKDLNEKKDPNSKEQRKKNALAKITEEFNNYDLPTGRTRGYLENMGMAWFLNYKLRAIKIATRMIRENPVHVLMVGFMPTPFSIGTPVTDNLFSKLFEGTLGYSIGPTMAMEPIGLNPWYNITR